MTPEPGHSPDSALTPQQHRIVALLAAGESVSRSAATENIHRNTIGYWRRTVPAFARELEFATQEQRQYWHEQAAEMAPYAIQTIHDSLTSPDSSPSLRFRAAVVVLKMATDPESKAPKPFPAQTEATATPESPTPAPAPENFDFVQTAKVFNTAQNCTKTAPPPVPGPRPPGRNSRCPCGSGLKFKRCCVS